MYGVQGRILNSANAISCDLQLGIEFFHPVPQFQVVKGQNGIKFIIYFKALRLLVQTLYKQICLILLEKHLTLTVTQ